MKWLKPDPSISVSSKRWEDMWVKIKFCLKVSNVD